MDLGNDVHVHYCSDMYITTFVTNVHYNLLTDTHCPYITGRFGPESNPSLPSRHFLDLKYIALLTIELLLQCIFF